MTNTDFPVEIDTFGSWVEVGMIIGVILAGILTVLFPLLFRLRHKKHRPNILGYASNLNWETHTRIHETLTELRVKTDAARAQIVQFHNSGNFLDGISMKKMSLTHESLVNGISSEMETKKDLLLSLCVEGLRLLMENEPKIHITANLEDSWCKQFMENSNVVSFSFLPIRNKGVVIGYVMCQWCSWSKTDEIIEDIAIEEITNSRKLIEVQLSHEREKMINK